MRHVRTHHRLFIAPAEPEGMRVCIVTESFLPQVNGVANSVRHVVDRLTRTGHQALVIAPGAGPTEYAGVPVVRARSLALPGYASFPLGCPIPPWRGRW